MNESINNNGSGPEPISDGDIAVFFAGFRDANDMGTVLCPVGLVRAIGARLTAAERTVVEYIEQSDDDDQAFIGMQCMKEAAEARAEKAERDLAAYILPPNEADRINFDQYRAMERERDAALAREAKLREAAAALLWHLCPVNTPVSFHDAWRVLDAALAESASPSQDASAKEPTNAP